MCHHLLIASRDWGAEGAGWVSFAIIAFQSSLEHNESFSKKTQHVLLSVNSEPGSGVAWEIKRIKLPLSFLPVSIHRL